MSARQLLDLTLAVTLTIKVIFLHNVLLLAFFLVKVTKDQFINVSRMQT